MLNYGNQNMKVSELIKLLEEVDNPDLDVYFAQQGRVLTDAYVAADYDNYSEICFYVIIE